MRGCAPSVRHAAPRAPATRRRRRKEEEEEGEGKMSGIMLLLSVSVSLCLLRGTGVSARSEAVILRDALERGPASLNDMFREVEELMEDTQHILEEAVDQVCVTLHLHKGSVVSFMEFWLKAAVMSFIKVFNVIKLQLSGNRCTRIKVSLIVFVLSLISTTRLSYNMTQTFHVCFMSEPHQVWMLLIDLLMDKRYRHWNWYFHKFNQRNVILILLNTLNCIEADRMHNSDYQTSLKEYSWIVSGCFGLLSLFLSLILLYLYLYFHCVWSICCLLCTLCWKALYKLSCYYYNYC